MRPFSPRALLSAALLAALAAGCGGGRKNPGDQVARDTTTSRPRGQQGGTVTAQEIQNNPGQPLEQNLNRFPGVVVSRTSEGGISVRIRGSTSFSSSTEPLYILDGVPVQPGRNGSLDINPADIATIQVLKDAVSTTMYGSRGANGVVVIKTKKPGQ